MVSFRALGFLVRLHLTFALIVVLFVLDADLPIPAILLWMVVAGASILVHEFGHALVVRRFGGEVENVTLHLMGGYTQWRPGYDGPLERRQRFIVSAAGSGLGIAVGLLVFLAASRGLFGGDAELIASVFGVFSDSFWLFAYSGDYVAFSALAFVWVSVFWGLINWVPVGGLDGSHMLREIWTSIDPENGARHTQIVGVIAAVVLGIILWTNGYRFAPLIFVAYAVADLMGTSISVD